MDRIFLEDITTPGLYRVAVVDTDRIFSAQNPGTLATVFERSTTVSRREDDAQIFYAMSPSIDADNIFIDLEDSRRSYRLNKWSINVKDSDASNLFNAINPLDRDSRLELYARYHSVTPDETLTSTSKSLFSLVAFAEKQSWKTGVLQRCIDCLVSPPYRQQPKVYAVIDEQYRRLMRFKHETENNQLPNGDDSTLIMIIRRIVESLGLKHSRDTTIFHNIPDIIQDCIQSIKESTLIPILKQDESIKNILSEIFFLWCGSEIVDCEGGYKLEINSDLTEGLNYMQPLLERPDILYILEAPM